MLRKLRKHWPDGKDIHLFTESLEPRDEVSPDFETLVLVQVGVMECKLDARLERFVESAHPVASKDQDPLRLEVSVGRTSISKDSD